MSGQEWIQHELREPSCRLEKLEEDVIAIRMMFVEVTQAPSKDGGDTDD